MVLSDTEKDKIKSKAMADLKKEHEDWNEQKLKMQAGRVAASRIKDAELDERKNEVRTKIQDDKPDLEGDDLEKAVNQQIKEEDNLEEITKLQEEKNKLLEDYDALTVKIANLRKGKKSEETIPRAKVEALLKSA